MTWPSHELARAVLRRLQELEDAPSHDNSLTRSENRRLVQGWRLLLSVHHQTADGTCKACPRLRGPENWGCPVWTLAHQQLVEYAGIQTLQPGGSAIPPATAAEETGRIPAVQPAQAFTSAASAGANSLPPLLLSTQEQPTHRPQSDPQSWPANSVLTNLPNEPALASLGSSVFEPVAVAGQDTSSESGDGAAALRQELAQYWAESPTAS